mmetsp:Transcript_8253/g.30445  ORF Transcript_8253/g.30445 Transcript_8253/m.30445 type:complete len:246 (+) Transcript_8253:95-832(+)
MRSPTFTRPRADCFVRSVTDAPVRERKTGALTGAQQWHLPLSWRRQRHLKRVPLRSALPVLFCKREEDGDERPRPRKTPPQRSVDSGSRAPNPSEVRQVRSDLLSWDFLAIWMHSLLAEASRIASSPEFEGWDASLQLSPLHFLSFLGETGFIMATFGCTALYSGALDVAGSKTQRGEDGESQQSDQDLLRRLAFRAAPLSCCILVAVLPVAQPLSPEYQTLGRAIGVSMFVVAFRAFKLSLYWY